MQLLDPALPHAYPRRILLAVAANSPQIITETCYALVCRSSPPWLPTEIHVITTVEGAQPIRHALFPEGQNWLQRLSADYDFPCPAFTEAHIHLITDASGQPLRDVYSAADNVCAADFITRTVQQFTADPSVSLHVSLSGGRRTMSYYVGYALSLFGRPQDRLSHVLVEQEYWFNHEFFYPPPQPLWVVREDGSGFDASKVEVTLAEIPFVRLRDGLPAGLLQGVHSFSETISLTQQRFDPPAVQLDWATPRLVCAGVPVAMPPVQLAFYAWMLQRRVQGQPPVHWRDEQDGQLASAFLQVYSRLFEGYGSYHNVAKALQGGISKAWFDERKSQVHKLLRQALGEQTAQAYYLQAVGKRPLTRWGIGLDTTFIVIK